MILRTLERFFSARSISKVILVVAADQLPHAQALLDGAGAARQGSWVLQRGGASRQQSVKAGLELTGDEAEIIAIHDGARPFVSPQLIDRSVEAARDKGAVVVGWPVRDTIKMVSAERWVESTPLRSALWEIQTPQVFRRDIILAAHDWAASHGVEATDDAMLVEQQGKKVFVLDGERTNIKITLPDDLWLAEALIRDQRIP